MSAGSQDRLLRKLRLTKERIIVIAILLVSLSVTAVLMAPMPAEFILIGDSVPVTDIGIAGSVYFAVVKSGITQNLADRWSVYLRYRNEDGDIEFTGINPKELTEYEDQLVETETMAYSVKQAVEAAVSPAGKQASDAVPSTKKEKTDQILAKLERYHGNSLGLMVAIGLYEEQHGVNFSKSRHQKISGTGTMEEGGWVGSVGGVKQKLLGAEADGVDLFFLPADYDWLGEDGNEAEARRVKQEYGLSLQIVPVESLTEAIKYLQEQDKGGLRIHDTN